MKTLLLISMLILTGAWMFAGETESESEGKYTINGYVSDENEEMLIGANIYIADKNIGTVSNPYGFYSITLPKGEYTLSYSFIGYEIYSEAVNLIKDERKNVKLLPATENIEEVKITAERSDANIREISMSTEKLQTKTIKKIPVLMGETDIIKSIQLLPGVQSSVEGSSGFYVRGGNADQNLILLDGATVYNPSHLFGFFSVFNSDAVKDVALYKGGIPAEYGGRLSSVLDLKMKEGNYEKIKGEGGIGTISSRFTLEGPVVKDKVSFIVSARRTYADLFLPFAKDTMAQQSDVYFYDLNAKVNYKINDRNRIFVSGYFGKDVNRFGNMFEMNYGNSTATVRWNHIYNGKLFSNMTAIYSDFSYNLGVPQGSDGFKWRSNIIDYSFKNDYTYYLNPNNTIKFGIQTTYHNLKPGVSEDMGEESFILALKFPEAYSMESAIFASNEQTINYKISLLYGLRFSMFNNIGEGTIYNFNVDYSLKDSSYYKQGTVFNTYTGWEPRIGIRYALTNKSSIKASYNRTVQYMHLASNSTATFPLDLWFMSNPNVKPQKADQVAVGYFRNFFDNTLETSVEGYYKKMYNTIDFRDHALLVPNKFLDGELRIGEAYAYGVEFMAKKQKGDFTGWLSYTYAVVRRKIPEINEGEAYPAPYDKPHNVSLVLTYDINKHLTISGNWVYSSALPVTVPVGGYYYGNVWLPVYSERGAVRIPGTAYHRLDLSLTFNFKLFGTESNMNASVYNVYNRKNAFAIYFRDKNLRWEKPEEGLDYSESRVDVVKLYLFPVVPSFTFNFKF